LKRKWEKRKTQKKRASLKWHFASFQKQNKIFFSLRAKLLPSARALRVRPFLATSGTAVVSAAISASAVATSLARRSEESIVVLFLFVGTGLTGVGNSGAAAESSSSASTSPVVSTPTTGDGDGDGEGGSGGLGLAFLSPEVALFKDIVLN
jgi:hypothetical protein